MDLDPRNNHMTISSTGTRSGHEKRQSGNDFTAYYFDQSVTLPVSDILAEQLGTELWKYGRSQDQGGFCANLQTANELGAQFAVHVGFFALISGCSMDSRPTARSKACEGSDDDAIN